MARGRGVCLRSTSARSRLHRGSLSRAERVVLEVELVEAAKGGRVRVHAECVEVEVVRRGAHLLEDVLQRDRLAVRRVRHHLVRRDAALLLDEAEQVPTATRARSLTDASRDVLSSRAEALLVHRCGEVDVRVHLRGAWGGRRLEPGVRRGRCGTLRKVPRRFLRQGGSVREIDATGSERGGALRML